MSKTGVQVNHDSLDALLDTDLYSNLGFYTQEEPSSLSAADMRGVFLFGGLVAFNKSLAFHDRQQLAMRLLGFSYEEIHDLIGVSEVASVQRVNRFNTRLDATSGTQIPLRKPSLMRTLLTRPNSGQPLVKVVHDVTENPFVGMNSDALFAIRALTYGVTGLQLAAGLDRTSSTISSRVNRAARRAGIADHRLLTTALPLVELAESGEHFLPQEVPEDIAEFLQIDVEAVDAMCC